MDISLDPRLSSSGSRVDFRPGLRMDIALEPLLKRPDLPQLVAALNSQLQHEKLARDKFLRELTPNMKAEFIGGEMIMHSPAKAKHIRVTGRLYKMLDMHVAKHKLGEVFFEKALVHLTRNDYEPDVLFYETDKAARIEPDQVLFPAPAFIAEVLSDSTESRDRGVKFEDYALHAVPEYWLIDSDQHFVEQYQLDGQVYKLFQKLHAGSIASLVVPGFEIPLAALFNDEAHRNYLLDSQ